MSRSSPRNYQRWTRWTSLAFVFFCGLTLFGFYAFHGIHKSDPQYGLEITGAWILTLSGLYIGIRTYRRGNSIQRRAVAAALAILISSMVMILLFSSYSDAPPSIPQPSDPGGGGY